MRLKFPHIGILITPWILLAIGATLNVLAVTVNQGYMPVAMSAVMRDCHEENTLLQILRMEKSKIKQDEDAPPPKHAKPVCTVPERGEIIDDVHRVMQSTDHLKILCDWIQVPRSAVLSPGDLFLWTSELLTWPAFIFWLALLWRDHNPKQS